MPRLNTDTMQQHAIGTFNFSGVAINDLGASEYTLVTIALDVSGSVISFQNELEETLKSIVQSCKYSPRANNLMLRVVYFNSTVQEIHGFKLLQDINPDDYKGTVQPNGSTALYEATGTSLSAMADYGKTLNTNDFSANGIIFVVTDGMDNASRFYTPIKISEDVSNIRKSENILESILTILIAIGDDSSLDKFSQDGKFDKYEKISNANAKSLAKLADFISKSISAQSQSLGTGGPSKSLPSLTI